MDVTVIGSSSFVPTLLNSWSSFFFDFGKGDYAIVDAGSWRLLTTVHKVTYTKHVLFTHKHWDHTLFFGGLLWRMRFRRRSEPLRILCPSNAYNRLQRLNRYFNPLGLPSFADLKGFTPAEPRRIGYLNASGTEIWAAAAQHTTTTAGYAFCQGNTKVVVAPDTAANSPTLLKLANNATAFFHDCTFPAGKEGLAKKKGHSTAEGAGYDAAKANAKTLVLIHMSKPRAPRKEELIKGARHYFDGKVLLAQDYATYTF